jgi:tetratricopeptide (TPR) repeat protein
MRNALLAVTTGMLGNTFRALVLLLALGLSAFAYGQDSPDHEHEAGVVTFPISCSTSAQRDFERAVELLHHMTYPQARIAFAELAQREPECAMAHWGIAMTLFQPLWPTRPGPAELQRGAAEVSAAWAAKPSTERERLFVAATAAFFDDAGAPAYWDRIRRWEAATRRLHAAFPDDPEATTFHALALLAVAPANQNARANADEAAGLLLSVYRKNPEHPGAMHYLVHANDMPGREHELLEIVRKYETAAPRNPHALHMPTHIYTRLGDWPAVIRGNLAAADAALEHPAGENGQYVWDEFPHAIEYLVYAYLQQGNDADAATQLQRLHAQERLEPTFKTAFHLASTSARYALERRDWEAASALEPRTPDSLDWDRFPWPEAVTWFARSLGAAHQQRYEDGGAAVQNLVRLEGAASAAGEDLFARSIRVLRLGASAWLAQTRGDAERARALMTEAAELEAATPKHAVTPAPTLPAFELLGDMLLVQERPAEALAAYERSLQLYPERFNGLLGAARAAHAAGQDDRARAAYQHLLEVAVGGTRTAALDEAQAFLRERERRKP